MHKEKKSVLIILDGWGYRQEKKDNAIAQALTPYYSSLLKRYPFTLLQASESFVGLPSGVMGNSEVGHTNIGCGRRVVQDQVKIYDAIANQSFFSNPNILQSIKKAKASKSAIHLMGLVSTGNVHSAQEHYFALLDMIAKNDFDMNRCFFHVFLDGRDTPPKSAKEFVGNLEQHLKKTGGRIATISGRYYAMDRDQRWERTQKAYDAIVHGEGVSGADPLSVIEASYQKNITDEFLVPAVLKQNGQPVSTIKNDDVVFCFNFRADRMRQMVRVLSGYEHGVGSLSEVRPWLVTMTQYDATFTNPILFPTDDLSMSLGEYFSVLHKHQFRIAETEKYAHVTFFFNGGRETPFSFEERVLIPSPKVATYDQTPAMHSALVTDGLVKAIESQKHDFLVVNYAQPDMVGHTGNWDAAISAVEATDQALEQVCETALGNGYQVFLTADHGNIEMLRDPVTGEPHTSHTLFPVPLIGIGDRMQRCQLTSQGSLSNIAPTILDAMGIPIPKEMTAQSLLVKG
ncbi:MAG: 2,3-bisphosphoglycerate-independent phosphoglycerate mutase [Bdellovibrionales bacterium]|nr:2,3-bisphosphoglycerate-independent phosphoglycerate mutase [Bdellovibrionales bacterium]